MKSEENNERKASKEQGREEKKVKNMKRTGGRTERNRQTNQANVKEQGKRIDQE